MLKESQLVLSETVAKKAESLYRSRQHLCADAMLLAFNGAFDGGLTEQQAVGLTSGMSIGQGDSGCLCGAVASGALVLGLFLGKDGAYRNAATIRSAVNDLHTRFKRVNKSTCCRVLTKKVKDDQKAHFEQCARYTGEAAGIVADILFERRPELIDRINQAYVTKHDSKTTGIIRLLFNRLFR
ncbi:C-GCAxxG-C-C family protein [Pseudodesulfovibrio sediminis]|uniref:C_GCAxxG_C_C family protein n=1 Tax=Pseudodesulfovibrio sediminis TaxID=2810563 RepID=A0ABM7P9M3_9BACT|nr:C-GCAxxG-C-C family protein [Pseudodesulfovibrio sediminis]BCS89769.1 hypothetical protein PSDVSF_30110 [Pseudodesulfovibrio sediminis]